MAVIADQIAVVRDGLVRLLGGAGEEGPRPSAMAIHSATYNLIVHHSAARQLYMAIEDIIDDHVGRVFVALAEAALAAASDCSVLQAYQSEWDRFGSALEAMRQAVGYIDRSCVPPPPQSQRLRP